MPTYTLFAARDGDVFRDTAEHPHDEDAEAWAAERIIAEFGLDHLDERDFQNVYAEIDGVMLDVERSSDVESMLLTWGLSQLSFLRWIAHWPKNPAKDEILACRSALLKLILKLQDAELEPV